MRIPIIIMNLLALTFLSSCLAYHQGGMQHAGYPDPNFQKVGKAYAQVSTNRILFFGGLGTDALLLEAQQKLETLHPLKPGEHFINYTYDYKRKYHLLGNQTELTISAEVVREKSFKPDYSQFDPISDLRSGDTIYIKPLGDYYEISPAAYISHEHNKLRDGFELQFFYLNERPLFLKQLIPLNRIFFSKMSVDDEASTGYKIGQKVMLENEEYRIVAYHRKEFILRNKLGAHRSWVPEQEVY